MRGDQGVEAPGPGGRQGPPPLAAAVAEQDHADEPPRQPGPPRAGEGEGLQAGAGVVPRRQGDGDDVPRPAGAAKGQHRGVVAHAPAGGFVEDSHGPQGHGELAAGRAKGRLGQVEQVDDSPAPADEVAVARRGEVPGEQESLAADGGRAPQPPGVDCPLHAGRGGVVGLAERQARLPGEDPAVEPPRRPGGDILEAPPAVARVDDGRQPSGGRVAGNRQAAEEVRLPPARANGLEVPRRRPRRSLPRGPGVVAAENHAPVARGPAGVPVGRQAPQGPRHGGGRQAQAARQAHYSCQ